MRSLTLLIILVIGVVCVDAILDWGTPADCKWVKDTANCHALYKIRDSIDNAANEIKHSSDSITNEIRQLREILQTVIVHLSQQRLPEKPIEPRVKNVN
jgi:hypothetical protein